VLICQLDVSGRSENDPAAERLTRNLIQYVAGWKPGVSRTVVYAGGEEGRSYLQSAGVPFTTYKGETLTSDQLLVGQAVAGQSPVQLALGLTKTDLAAFSPIKFAEKEHIATYFEPFPADSPFAGISPAEVQNRSPRRVSLISEGATAIGDGVLAMMSKCLQPNSPHGNFSTNLTR